jgi:hypothetical protein
MAYTIAIKLVGYAGSIFYKHFFSNKTYVYFMNAGYGINKMYRYAFTADMIVYLLMVIVLFSGGLVFGYL